MNFAAEVYPKSTGLVVAECQLCAMTWGFPRRAVSKKTGKPLKPTATNNASDDQLRGNPMSRDSFRERRSLISVTAWAEAEGPAGSMTPPGIRCPVKRFLAVAGSWRPTEEWGKAYSMIMVDGCEQMAGVHDRMPAILVPVNWAIWTQGTPDEAFALCRVWDSRLAVDRTDHLWSERATKGQAFQAGPTDEPVRF